MSFRSAIASVWLALLPVTAYGTESPADIVNFRQYTDRFASAGQPSAEQLEQLPAAGFERVIYIAFSDQERSLSNEDRRVKTLGMSYVQIPVIWNAPQQADFALFAASMRQAPQQKTLLHCQVNYRASAFALLYRVIYEKVDLAKAKADMNSVWVPDETWTQFIQTTLRTHNIEPMCQGCDWTPAEY